MYSVPIEKFVKEFQLENVMPEISLKGKLLTSSDVNRPALQLAGYFDYFENDMVQIVGQVEFSYLERLEPMFREDVLRKLFSFGFPCLVICNSMEMLPEIGIFAKEFDVPVFRTSDRESDFIGEINRWLKGELAKRVTLHGVLVDIYGEGILIIGDSGVGKSEAALELIKRGHRLVADDAVEIKKISHETLIGTCPELIRYFIELRGIGIIDVRELFGVGSIKQEQTIDLVIKLEFWDDEKIYDRMGLEDEYYEILGNNVVCNSIPIRSGRNIAVICEAAAINCRQKKLGYNAAKVLSERLEKSIEV
ncbi:MAG: HPr(Ser) kinase/phosphatase [Lachnospiraceae bacterium]|nr:HPr(Ser) kinase/phosphatase [Lachnospiraceae bacterium]